MSKTNMTEMIESRDSVVGEVEIGGRWHTIVRLESGGLIAVGLDNDTEDWALVKASVAGSPWARMRISSIEEEARQAAVQDGVIHTETVGIEGYTHEHRPVTTDSWHGDDVYLWRGHVLAPTVSSSRVCVQGRGYVLCTDITLRLLPSRTRGGRLLYDAWPSETP